MEPLDIDALRARLEALKANQAPREAPRPQERIEELTARAGREDRMRRVRSASIVGMRFEARTFETLEPELLNRRAIETAWLIVEDPRVGAAFWGPPGCGKTHLAGAIVHACIERGIPAVMDTVSSLLRRIRSTYDGASKITEEEMVERIISAPVLVLDDLGKERLTEWSAAMLWDMLNARYERALPLILTANSNLGGLSAHYSRSIPGVDAHTLPAMMRRIVEMTGEWIDVRGSMARNPRGAA